MYSTMRRSYVIRTWQESEQPGGTPINLFILKDTATEEQQGFTSADSLLQVLRHVLQPDIEDEK